MLSHACNTKGGKEQPYISPNISPSNCGIGDGTERSPETILTHAGIPRKANRLTTLQYRAIMSYKD